MFDMALRYHIDFMAMDTGEAVYMLIVDDVYEDVTPTGTLYQYESELAMWFSYGILDATEECGEEDEDEDE